MACSRVNFTLYFTVACSTRGRQQLLEKVCSENAERRDLSRPVRSDNIKMDVTEIGWEV